MSATDDQAESPRGGVMRSFLGRRRTTPIAGTNDDLRDDSGETTSVSHARAEVDPYHDSPEMVPPWSDARDNREDMGPAGSEPAGISIPISDTQPTAPNIGDTALRPGMALLSPPKEHPLPNVALDAGRLGPYWLSASSSVGRRHSWAGETRQDSYAFALSDDRETVAVAVADGLGSRRYSQVGARCLTSALCRRLALFELQHFRRLGKDVLLNAVHGAQNEMIAVGRTAFGVTDTRLLASTMALAWVPVDPASSPALVCRVGDATVFSGTSADSEPFSSIFEHTVGPLNVVSASLPMLQIDHNSVEIVELDLQAINKLVLCTDGCADDIYQSPGVRSWLAQRWVQPCTERWMLETMSYARRGSDDDRTAAVLWVSPESHPASPTPSGE